MREPLRIAVAQPVCARHDVAGNAVRHARAARSARAPVVVVTEQSRTGSELAAAARYLEGPGLETSVCGCAVECAAARAAHGRRLRGLGGGGRKAPPGQPAMDTTGLPAVRASGRPTEACLPRRGRRPGRSLTRRSAETEAG